ncbi:MAG TPA: hypothetical protein VM286_05890 [Candidatus Thermoplasmatota archaeon]|nr:hypothetical protein [Candidatus Thermoplasmatota archaeon]
MALKSTVLAPPPAAPAPRATTVLRVGPPPKKGLLDLSLGILGLLLLLSTVGLAMALPHKDVLPQQFNVAYLDDLHPEGNTVAYIAAGQSHDFEYEVKFDDVYSITIAYGFLDDVPASAPDQFVLRLYDPNGNSVGPPGVVAMNRPAEGDPDAAPTCPDVQLCTFASYKPLRFTSQLTVLLPKPNDDIVEVQDQGMTEKKLAADLQAKAHVATKGIWTIKVAMPLNGAGGCVPPSGPSQDDANRFLVCQQEVQAAQQPGTASAQGGDAGNEFSIDYFTYVSFVADAKKIG